MRVSTGIKFANASKYIHAFASDLDTYSTCGLGGAVGTMNGYNMV